ncbi:multidrug transporter [Reyranella soli]|uniref:Multidrug transporter n=2 Tax=Reyranella soli TaxID=1230389 RepID=A0A512NCK9_9HYPH|nr:multidrug transporter [Reyranella soli]
MNKGIWSKVGAVGLMAGLVVAGWFIVTEMGRDRARAAASTQVPPVPVVTDIAVTKDMPVMVRGIGTVQAYEAVAVKTRVDGQIVKVAFTEGQFVKAGDLLFQIDPAPLQAVLDHANAAKQRDEAQLAGAKLDLERYGKLIGSGYQSRQSFDQQHATVDALTATVALDQATIDTAKVNLAFTDIRAPIDGRTGQRLVDVGNVLQANQAVPLVNITRIKPIFVNFTVPQDVADPIRHAQAAAPLTVIAFAADDKTKLSQGKLTLIDNQIDAATGTLRLKATFDNADERLWPGEFVNVRLVTDVRVGAVTVPERAIMQGPEGYYAYTVNPDNTVQRHPIEIASMQDGLAVVAHGLANGDKVVVDGQYRLSEGSSVKIDTASPAGQSAAAGKAG